jgi:hypothetical protein
VGNSEIILDRQGTWGAYASGLKLMTESGGSRNWTIGMQPDSTNNLYIRNNNNIFLKLDITGNMTVDSSTFYVDAYNNRVGVGTITPTQKLDVAGNINVSSAGSCLYLPGSGKICGNTTCLWITSPDGLTTMKVANNATTC